MKCLAIIDTIAIRRAAIDIWSFDINPIFEQ